MSAMTFTAHVITDGTEPHLRVRSVKRLHGDDVISYSVTWSTNAVLDNTVTISGDDLPALLEWIAARLREQAATIGVLAASEVDR